MSEMQVPVITDPSDIISSGYPIIPSVQGDVPIDAGVLSKQLKLGSATFKVKTKCIVNPLELPSKPLDVLQQTKPGTSRTVTESTLRSYVL